MDSQLLELKVRQILVEALNCDQEEVKTTASLQGDLGAESIDYLDIVFRLEREFSIKIPRNELFPEGIFQGGIEYVQNGMVTLEGVTKLKEAMPYSDFSEFEKSPKVENIGNLFTMGTLVRYLQTRVS